MFLGVDYKMPLYLVLYYVFDCSSDHFFIYFMSSDVPVTPVINGMPLSPLPEVEVQLANPNLLHRLVSEGNVTGVR